MKNGPPDTSFFLLRGLSREIRHWGDFPNLLANKSTDYRSIPLEIPGNGKLRNVPSPLTIDQYVVEIRKQYMAAMRKEDRNILLGLSFGGMIAAAWLHDFPGDFDGIILINMSSQLSQPYKRLRPTAAIGLLLASLSGNTLLRERTIARVICNLADSGKLALAWQKITESAPIKRRNTLRQLYAASTFYLPVAPDIPSLLLASDNDRLVHHSCSRRIAEVWEAELISHPQAGHDLPADDPCWCCEAIFSWLRKEYGG